MDHNDISYLIERMCLRKKNLSEEEAHRIIDQNAREGEVGYFYKCPLCGSHHTTWQVPENLELLFDYK